MVKVSIITINYNDQNGLKKTMESVFRQIYSNFEYIIIDGNSTDGSKDIIQKHATQLQYWVSESDNGIYHAMNKGASLATGDYLLFLNSGDFFVDQDSLNKFRLDSNKEDIIYANIAVRSDSDYWIQPSPSKLSFDFFISETLPHQGSVIRRALFELMGGYDESLTLVADWAFFVKALCIYKASYKYLNETVTEYNLKGLSSRAENKPLMLGEKGRFLHTEFSMFMPDYVEHHQSQTVLKRYRLSTAHSFVKKVVNILTSLKRREPLTR